MKNLSQKTPVYETEYNIFKLTLLAYLKLPQKPSHYQNPKNVWFMRHF